MIALKNRFKVTDKSSMGQIIFLFSILSTFTVAIAQDEKDCSDDLSKSLCLFSKPLLVGASLTRGQGANPGGAASIIATSLNPNSQITNISRSGAKSVDSLKDHEVPANPPSVVIGLDLFFWDAARNDCGDAFEANTKSFIKMYLDKGIPLILGKISKNVRYPVGYNRLLNQSLCINKINLLLEQECTIDKNCLLYNPRECLDKISEENQAAFFVDRLHTSIVGNRFCAEDFIATSRFKDLKCLKN